MANTINNTLPGLVSTNPFTSGTSGANLGIGGTTTPTLAPSSTTLSPSNNGLSQTGTYQNTPISSYIPSGNIVANRSTGPGTSNISAPVPTSAPQTGGSTGGAGTGGTNTYGLTSSSPNWYQLQPGETTANYYARTQGQTQTAALAQTQPTGGSTGSGTGGGAAPAGMMYNGQGQLVPLDNSQTVNGAGQNTSIASNVATGGGTQTNFPSIVGGLASTSASPSAAFTTAQGQQAAAQQGLLQTQLSEASALGDNASTPIPIEFQQGRGAIIQAEGSQQAQAYATQEQNAIQAEQAATGQQGTQQSGLAAAGGLAQPQQVNPTNVPYNPLNGQYGTPAITNFSSNGSVASGAQALGAFNGQQAVGQNITQLNSQLGGAQVAGQNLQSLITQNNINPSALTFANGALQLGAQYTSNPAYAKFQGAVNDFISAIAPVLGAGGNVTDMKTQMSSQIVSSLQSGSTMNDVISYFLQQAQQKIQGMSTGGGAGVGSTQNNGTSNTSNQYSWNYTS